MLPTNGVSFATMASRFWILSSCAADHSQSRPLSAATLMSRPPTLKVYLQLQKVVNRFVAYSHRALGSLTWSPCARRLDLLATYAAKHSRFLARALFRST